MKFVLTKKCCQYVCIYILRDADLQKKVCLFFNLEYIKKVVGKSEWT